MLSWTQYVSGLLTNKLPWLPMYIYMIIRNCIVCLDKVFSIKAFLVKDFSLIKMLFWPISHQYSHPIPPENTNTLLVFWCFQGGVNRKIGQKWVKMDLAYSRWLAEMKWIVTSFHPITKIYSYISDFNAYEDGIQIDSETE